MKLSLFLCRVYFPWLSIFPVSLFQVFYSVALLCMFSIFWVGLYLPRSPLGAQWSIFLPHLSSINYLVMILSYDWSLVFNVLWFGIQSVYFIVSQYEPILSLPHIFPFLVYRIFNLIFHSCISYFVLFEQRWTCHQQIILTLFRCDCNVINLPTFSLAVVFNT